MIGLDSTPVKANGVYVLVPANTQGTIKLSITSIDGVYEGKPEYEVNTTEADTMYLKWPTLYRDKLINYEDYQVAILATLYRGQGKGEVYLPTRWQREVGDADAPLTVLLNSRMRTYIKIEQPNSDKKKRIPCSQIEAENKTAFNCICQIPRKLLSPEVNLSVVQRLRRDGSISYTSYKLPLLLK